MVFMAGSADSGPEFPALWGVEARNGNVLLAAKKRPIGLNLNPTIATD
jgi:hypothetical protein